MNIIAKSDINEELLRIQNMQVGVMTNPRTPLCIILDFSGSMESYMDRCKSILRQMASHLKTVGKRYFTLIIIGIHNSKSNILYFGELRNFDVEAFLLSLPDHCKGKTPLVNSFHKADYYLTEVSRACDISSQICTIPFYFIVTDAKSTENPEHYTGILKTLSDDVKYNRKIIVECVTMENEEGLDFGGYKILIDNDRSEMNIINCMKALQLASSTDVDAAGGLFEQKSRPPKHKRKEYGDYLSNILATNVLFYFNNLSGK